MTLPDLFFLSVGLVYGQSLGLEDCGSFLGIEGWDDELNERDEGEISLNVHDMGQTWLI